MSWLLTVEMIRILKKQFRRPNAVWNMLVRKFSFAPMEAKIQLFKLYCHPIYGCGLWHHSYQNFIRKLTVSFSDTSQASYKPPQIHQLESAFEMNWTDHINVVFCKFAYSLMSTVTASPNSVVSAIVNSDAYHQSPRQLGEYVICLGIMIDQIISQYVNVWWMTF